MRQVGNTYRRRSPIRPAVLELLTLPGLPGQPTIPSLSAIRQPNKLVPAISVFIDAVALGQGRFRLAMAFRQPRYSPEGDLPLLDLDHGGAIRPQAGRRT